MHLAEVVVSCAALLVCRCGGPLAEDIQDWEGHRQANLATIALVGGIHDSGGATTLLLGHHCHLHCSGFLLIGVIAAITA